MTRPTRTTSDSRQHFSGAGYVPSLDRARLALQIEQFSYYDLPKHWTRRIEPHLGNEELNDILVRDFNRFLGPRGKRFRPGDLPEQYESCDWRWSHGRRGKQPRYWRYVKHAACHYIVNFALKLAMLAEPQRKWRIVTSDEHSTVWDGEHTFFDFNFLALGISVKQCFELSFKGRILRPGEFRRTYGPRHHITPNSAAPAGGPEARQ